MFERFHRFFEEKREAKRERDFLFEIELLTMGSRLQEQDRYRLGWTVQEIVDMMNAYRRLTDRIDDIRDEKVGPLVSALTQEGLLFRSQGKVRNEFIVSASGIELVENFNAGFEEENY